MAKVHITRSIAQTQKIAEELASKLHGGEVLALFGELGAGKTTFTQGLARALGVARNVNSPTFIIHRSYKISSMYQVVGIKCFHHIDLYRIGDANDLGELGLEEILKQQDSVVVIEWPEKIGELLPKERIDVKFEYIGENERRISVSKLI